MPPRPVSCALSAATPLPTFDVTAWSWTPSPHPQTPRLDEQDTPTPLQAPSNAQRIGLGCAPRKSAAPES
eukprot:3092658-Pyramimonas_sp.AAC.1